jgi:hypothetical protein
MRSISLWNWSRFANCCGPDSGFFFQGVKFMVFSLSNPRGEFLATLPNEKQNARH